MKISSNSMKPTKSILILLSLFLTFSCDENPITSLVCGEGTTNVDGVCTLVWRLENTYFLIVWITCQQNQAEGM